MKVIEYDQDEFPLVQIVADLIGIDCALSDLYGDMALVTRENDQSTSYHTAFYGGFHRMRETYERFVHHIVAGHVEAPYCFQAVPTFRVQLPDNKAVGEFHKYADYNHPQGEVNFWVPLTPVSKFNTVWVAPEPGATPEPCYAQPGEVLMFDAVNLLHGNVVNTTSMARVSFDFRCLPLSLHTDTDAATVNTNLRFVVGGYYLTDDQSLELPE